MKHCLQWLQRMEEQNVGNVKPQQYFLFFFRKSGVEMCETTGKQWGTSVLDKIAVNYNKEWN